MNSQLRLLLVTGAVLAALCPRAGAAAAAPIPPDQVARSTADDVLGEINSNRGSYKTDPGKLDSLVENRVLPHFDFDRIDRFVLGQFWSQATPEQRERFSKAFQHMLVRSYSAALLTYKDSKIQWAPLHVSPADKEVVVKSTVTRSEGPPIPIDYSMALNGNEWRVYDVNINAVSLATNFRSTFVGDIRKNGIDAVISHLEQNQAGKQAAN